MALLNPSFSTWQKACAVIGALMLFLGFGALVYSEFSTSVGFQGVVNHGISGISFGVMGLSFCLFTILLGFAAIESITEDPANQQSSARDVFRELGVIALNGVCYLGVPIFALGSFVALDTATVPAAIAIALCVMAFVLYRRHRKRHKMEYRFFKPFGVVLFLAAFVIATAVMSVIISSEAIVDALSGPRTANGSLVDLEEDRPRGRGSFARAATVNLKFASSEEVVSLSVKKQDAATLQQFIDAGSYARLTYYPRTGVFVSVEPLI